MICTIIFEINIRKKFFFNPDNEFIEKYLFLQFKQDKRPRFFRGQYTMK
jgi:hypothetical protein